MPQAKIKRSATTIAQSRSVIIREETHQLLVAASLLRQAWPVKLGGLPPNYPAIYRKLSTSHKLLPLIGKSID